VTVVILKAKYYLLYPYMPRIIYFKGKYPICNLELGFSPDQGHRKTNSRCFV